MECAAPEPAGIDRQQIHDATKHFPCSFICEREKQNVSRIDPVFEKIRHAIGKGSGLSRSGTGDDQKRTRRRSYCCKLLLIELGGIVDMNPAIAEYWRALQRILAGHLDSCWVLD